jgi:hypothetical protein
MYTVSWVGTDGSVPKSKNLSPVERPQMPWTPLAKGGGVGCTEGVSTPFCTECVCAYALCVCVCVCV